MNLQTSLMNIKGVGDKLYAQFSSAGIETVGDLLHFFPKRHEDFSHIAKIRDIKPGKVTIEAVCEEISTRTVRRGLRVTTATLSDETGKIRAVWFNQPYRATQLKDKTPFFFTGEYEFQYNRYQLTNPSAEKRSEAASQSDLLVPVYKLAKGLKSQTVRKILAELKPLIAFLPETLPSEIVAQYNLVGRSEAFLGIHFPTTQQDVAQARKRLAFEEVFQLLLASQLNKDQHSKLEGWHIPFDKKIVKSFVEQLPFALTDAQRRAAWEIIQDFERESPMNRLLQGDVGSGKTVVAGIAALQAARAGYQTAFLAPTELLAVQHAETLSTLLKDFDIRVGLLTGKVKGAARTTIYEALATGEVDVIVGTHAIIQSKVAYHNLGFVVIDEQHRFGVEQRQKLLEKSKRLPHLLAMTATPIPRSLALTVYGELDVSILDELPKNRKPIKTKIWSPNSRQQVYDRIEEATSQGQQAYIICSLIDDNPDNDKKSVEREYARLQRTVFKHRNLGMLHGKMRAQEKDEVMRRFAAREIDILISTTVVEVGIDVPNATIIMIENSDMFGLAQLHQLRGRVGRGEHQSYAFLVMSDSNAPSRRLREIEKSTDGFYLAEVDLELRGPGEVYGRAQHGALNLQVATLADTKLIAQAKQAATLFIKQQLSLDDFPSLKDSVTYYQRLTTLN